MPFSRRDFIGSSLALTAVGLGVPFNNAATCWAETGDKSRSAKMRYGLVTYMWGADWDLPTLIANCQKARAEGVELRTEHAHQVEPNLSAAERREVKAQFVDSPVALVGLGSNEAFHYVDQDAVKKCIEKAKAYIKLSHDVGGSGVKVKPNDLPSDVPRDKTIEQIGRSLNELGTFAADFGQQVRLEVHGQCQPLPIIAAIMEVAEHPSIAVCWNSNGEDLKGEGLAHNFHLVEKRLGATTHVHEFDFKRYPYPELFKLLKQVNYGGWILCENSTKPADRVAALVREREVFDQLVSS